MTATPELTPALSRELLAAGRLASPLWSACEWCGTALLADRPGTGETIALAPVQVTFAPDEDESDDADEESRALWTLPRYGTAVLVFDRGTWRPTGRVLFNVSPAEAPARLAGGWIVHAE